MATFSFFGFTITQVDDFIPGGHLQISVPVDVSELTYRITQAADPGGDRGILPLIEWDLPDAATYRLDGDFQGDMTFELGEVTHSGGSARILLVDIETEERFGEDRQMFFVFNGAFDVSSRQDFEAIAGSVVERDGTQRDGPLAPGTPLDVSLFPQIAISEDDLLIGEADSETIGAGRGDDTLVGGAGDDRLIGGPDRDVIDYFIESEVGRDPNEVVGITVRGAQRKIVDTYGDTDSYQGVEAIYGSINADLFRGPTKGSLIVTGSQFEDQFIGAVGGTGQFLVDYLPEAQWGGGQGVTVDLARNRATDGFGDVDTLTRVDGVRGTANDDQMQAGTAGVAFLGMGGRDSLKGGKGRDTLEGGLGVDTLLGGAGADDLEGGAGADKLNGGLGGDTLVGGAGRDVMTGKGGRDTFVFEAGDGRDRITDFNLNQDSLEIDSDLLAARIAGPKQLVNRYGEIDGKKAVLDFGKGDVLALNGVDDLSALAERIDIL